MQIPQDAVLLRIFFGEDDRQGHMALYEAIVLKAREMQLAGATVLRGSAGFGHSWENRPIGRHSLRPIGSPEAARGSGSAPDAGGRVTAAAWLPLVEGAA